MALFDFLKRKDEAEKARSQKKDIKKPVKKPGKASVATTSEKPAKPEKQDKKDEKKIEVSTVSRSAKKGSFYYEAIKQPHISEKATYLGEKNQYVFEISPNYNKNEIKKSVEGIYGVDVLSVNIVKIPAKKRRIGKTEGFKKRYTKAIVKIKEGQKIEIL